MQQYLILRNRALYYIAIIIIELLTGRAGIVEAAILKVPQNIRPIGYGLSEVYYLGTSQQLVVHIDYGAKSKPILIDWRDAQGLHSEQFSLPDIEKKDVDPEFAPVWWPSDDDTSVYEPHVILWHGEDNPTIVVVAERPSGVYDIRSPIVLQLIKRRWRCLTTQPSSMEFTDRGAFHVTQKDIYVWDYINDPRYGHGDPQRYFLKKYRLVKNRLYLEKTMTTRKRYLRFTNYVVSRDRDPLREFGLKWRWWGQNLH